MYLQLKIRFSSEPSNKLMKISSEEVLFFSINIKGIFLFYFLKFVQKNFNLKMRNKHKKKKNPNLSSPKT
ncbi:hypothetical protein KUTeg_011637 [Tegillarca granosa]|uniref:ATP synthase F0 subunit 8 n=1 Tax=Tegillarca granosa TaxID=220873 RepID=A0ABQ9EX83_TEGGR|nr:hypothetical protein KUTeg_011637 [Tegillarca granosa]